MSCTEMDFMEEWQKKSHSLKKNKTTKCWFHVLEWSRRPLRIFSLTQRLLDTNITLKEAGQVLLDSPIMPQVLETHNPPCPTSVPLLRNPASGCQSGFTHCGRSLCQSSPNRLSLHFLLGYVWCCWGLKQNLKTT